MRSRRGGRSERPMERAVKPQAETFWQKVVAFFSPEPLPNPEHGAQPTRSEPRRNGSPRSERRFDRKPEIVEVTSPKLYVGNLSFDASESDLFDLFNGVGKVQNAEVVSHRHTQRSKGFAFVTMSSTDEARRAVEELHNKEFMGRKLVVSGAKSGDSAERSRNFGD
jgi:RNA recognition motif-containing protein